MIKTQCVAAANQLGCLSVNSRKLHTSAYRTLNNHKKKRKSNLKLICFTNSFLHNLSDSFWIAFAVQWALAFACFYIFLAKNACDRLSFSYSDFESTLNSTIVSYPIVQDGNNPTCKLLTTKGQVYHQIMSQ